MHQTYGPVKDAGRSMCAYLNDEYKCGTFLWSLPSFQRPHRYFFQQYLKYFPEGFSSFFLFVSVLFSLVFFCSLFKNFFTHHEYQLFKISCYNSYFSKKIGSQKSLLTFLGLNSRGHEWQHLHILQHPNFPMFTWQRSSHKEKLIHCSVLFVLIFYKFYFFVLIF